MNFTMTRITYSNNIKPILRFVAKIMMIRLCSCPTKAFKRLWQRQYLSSDCLVYNSVCFDSIGMFFASFINSFLRVMSKYFIISISSICRLSISLSTFFCRIISQFSQFARNLSSFSRMIFSAGFRVTLFAMRTKAIFFADIFRELRDKFDFFAFGTFFSYDLLSHNQLLKSWLRLEPFTRPILVRGSSYYNKMFGGCNPQNAY